MTYVMFKSNEILLVNPAWWRISSTPRKAIGSSAPMTRAPIMGRGASHHLGRGPNVVTRGFDLTCTADRISELAAR
jgi:hypothetical protein